MIINILNSTHRYLKTAAFAAISVSLILLLIPFSAICGVSTATASDNETARIQTLSDQSSADNLHLLAQVGYGPPTLDLDAYDGGGLSLNLGAQYLFVRGLGAGIRTRLTRLFLKSDSVTASLMDIQVVAGLYVLAGLELHLAMGATIAGSFSYGEIVSNPYFSMAFGLSYTFWLGKAVGLELGTELSSMFDDDFERMPWKTGVATDNIFMSLLFYAGLRFSLEKVNGEKERRQ